ncbi:CocE/NonD family hydrolase [Gordonia desulfuricans]|uniref:CocE/NonD family hydrolase n=1 Tax=Gordonia desulfuricans TaxID=89051 RepID=A0A7K3LKH2_9ACTN|nr:CocE/NonD family hydrolase [Gordonia desulfuricans]NDK88698.1 CocE/NonD family hydrolase [Gordonia desulfuricans]
MSRGHRSVGKRLVVRATILLCSLAVVVTGGVLTSAVSDAAPTTSGVGRGAGSVTQAYLTGATPGASVVLRDAAGTRVGAGHVDRLGSFLVRELAPGGGYRFEVGGRSGNSFAVLGEAPPPTAQFGQALRPGMNYIRVRDGITLAAMVRLPVGKTLADGPFPTLVEYSGYQIAAPGDFVLGALGSLARQPDPRSPAISTMLGGIIGPTAGFATVNVAMRGSGCSGGAFGLFDLPTTYDGYDVVETVARQPWVAHHKVGMVGISFSGISQIAVAGTRPPSLAAIAPMSITDDLYSTGFPGGIFNTGFANTWLAERQRDAAPAPAGGQPYPRVAIADGDRICADNQRLRLQSVDAERLVADNPTRTPSVHDHRSPSWWASRITVPVYLAGALQDEQTGPQWTAIIPRLAHNPNVWVKMINGSHFDSTHPQILGPWNEFLDIFVAHRVPTPKPALTALGPVLYEATSGTPGRPIVTARHPDAGSLSRARTLFAQDPRIQVFFGNGNGTGTVPPGNMSAPWSAGFSSWPPASVGDGHRLALGVGGTLGGAGGSGEVSFRPDPSARPAGTLDVTGPSMLPWKARPPYDWAPIPGQAGVGFTSAPQQTDTTVVGPASLDLRLASSAPDTDLQATVSEVRPDGREQLVTTGYLRASLRATDDAATALHPARDWLSPQPLPSGFSTARISLEPIAYTFRAGSRIRVTVTAPGGDRTSWRFDTPATGGRIVDTLALGPGGSSLVLPVVPGLRAGSPSAPCEGLRGQPCRVYTPAFNGG